MLSTRLEDVIEMFGDERFRKNPRHYGEWAFTNKLVQQLRHQKLEVWVDICRKWVVAFV